MTDVEGRDGLVLADPAPAGVELERLAGSSSCALEGVAKDGSASCKSDLHLCQQR